MSKVTIMQSQGRSGVFSFTGTITVATEKAIKVEANGVSVWYPKAAVKQVNASLIEIAAWYRYTNKAILLALTAGSSFVDGETIKKALPKAEVKPTADDAEKAIQAMFAKLRSM